ncbi:hypothetical protein U9M48_039117 [Paspalum notatum var. saurae]|uniref:DUF4283 domain-containing protein n=1 Tax=Paspalum notatum var. saurae TaxID=547442 RepID=A0AAQ3UMY7_PASNO
MEFSEKKDVDEWKYAIPKVWIQFRGLSKELRDFPIIWAIGSILGATRKVDMKFTKLSGRARLQVAMLNPEYIPEFIDIVIGDYVYELQFRVEKEGEGAMPTLIDMDTQPEEDGNKEYERQDEDKENGENNAKKENEHEAKGQQTTTVANGSGVVGTSAAASQNSKHVFALNYTGLNGTEAWRATSLVVDQPVPPVKLGTKSGIPSSEFVADAYMTPTRKSKRSSIQGDHWLRLWAQLQRTNDKKEEVVEACKSLEFSAMELFSSFGWPFVFRIGF